MHVLITGGAGFIGSHLVDLHLARGDSVHVVDDLSTGARGNIAQHEDNPNFRFDEAKHGPEGARRFSYLQNYSLRGVTEMHVLFDRID